VPPDWCLRRRANSMVRSWPQRFSALSPCRWVDGARASTWGSTIRIVANHQALASPGPL